MASTIFLVGRTNPIRLADRERGVQGHRNAQKILLRANREVFGHDEERHAQGFAAGRVVVERDRHERPQERRQISGEDRGENGLLAPRRIHALDVPGELRPGVAGCRLSLRRVTRDAPRGANHAQTQTHETTNDSRRAQPLQFSPPSAGEEVENRR